jgi:PEP-CTERM motif
MNLLRATLLGLGLATVGANIAGATTWDLLSGTLSPSGHPNGNKLTVNGPGGVLEVTGWSTNNGGSKSAQFVDARIFQFSPYGIGLCDRGEAGLLGLGCILPPNHTFDNAGRTDFALFMFDSDVSIDSVDLTGFGDTDITYFVGHSNAFTTGTWDISGLTPAAFGTEHDDLGPVLNIGTRTVDINSVGNFLLIGAALDPGQDCVTSGSGKRTKTKCSTSYDYVKFKSITTSAITTSLVPEPATWSLMILGFGLMATALRRRPVRA